MKHRNFLRGLAFSLLTLFAAASAQANTTVTTSVVTNKPEQAVIGGAVTVNDTLTITVHDAALPGGQEPVSYVVKTGDTKAKIAAGLTTAIKADANLKAIGVTAVKTAESSKQIVTISSKSPNTTTYTASVNAGGTETIALSVNANVVENAAIGGTATVGDKLTITVSDAGLTGGQQLVTYTVVSGDTAASMAAGLAANASANTKLKGIGITATAASASGVVTFKSLSLNVTTYSAAVTGTSETVSLSVNPNAINDIVVGGTPAAGDFITVGIADPYLSNGEVVGYTVKAGDSVGTIACKLNSALNADTTLSGVGISSTCTSSGVASLESDSPNQLNFTLTGGVSFITCTDVPNYTGPGKLRTCGRAQPGDAQVQTVMATLEALGNPAASPGGALAPDGAAKLNAATSLVYYVFHDKLEYQATAQTPAGNKTPFPVGVPSDEALGATFLRDPKNPTAVPYTVIFEFYGATQQIVNVEMANTAAHETGHELDWIYGGKVEMFSRGTTANPGPFGPAFDKDLLFANLVPACQFTASDRRNVGPNNDLSGDFGAYSNPQIFGFFYAKLDYLGNFICTGVSLQPPYTGFPLDGSGNRSLIFSAYPQIQIFVELELSLDDLRGPDQELFAEEYANQVGFPDKPDGNAALAGSDQAFSLNGSFGGSFACTQLYTTSLTKTGAVPTPTQLNQTGTTQPLTFSGDVNGVVYGAPAKSGQGATGFDGAISKTLHSCDGSTSPNGSWNFGGGGG